MKKFIKSLAVISAIFLALGGFVSCSNGSDDDPAPTPKTFTVTISKTENGTVTADKTSGVTEGTEVTLTVTPANGYELGTLSVKNDTADVTVTNNKFKMPAGNVTVSATFKSVGTPVTNLQVAPLVDHAIGENSTVNLATDYSCSAYYKDSAPSTVYVTITARNLSKHKNAGDSTSYWVGLAIPKTESCRAYWKDSNSKGTFGNNADATWTDSNVEYSTFYFGSNDGSFSKEGIIEVGANENSITKTYVITFDVTTKPFTVGYIKGSGTASNYKLQNSDYPEGKTENTSADWVNDTVWLKFSDVTSISGKYVWMKFVGKDKDHQAAASLGKVGDGTFKAGRYRAASFLDTANNNQWDYMAAAMKDSIRTNVNTRGAYKGEYTVEVYAFGTEQKAPTDSTFASFGKGGTLIGSSKITVVPATYSN